MTTTVRRAEADDAASLARIAALTFALACPPGTLQSDIDDFIETTLSEKRMSHYLADPQRQLFLAEVDGPRHGHRDWQGDEHWDGQGDEQPDEPGDEVVRVAGYTMVVFPAAADSAPSDPDVAAVVTARPTAELSKCYVDPAQHGAGVATALVEASVAAAVDRGCSSIWLGVNQLNARANAFYERNGFARVGVKRFKVGDEWHDDFVRERLLRVG